MEDDKLVRVFDRVKLSPEREEAMLADLLCEKKEVSSMKHANRRRIPAAAVAAAVLVAVLAGTALAEGYFGRMDVQDDGDIYGAFENIPPERLSEELLEHAAQANVNYEELTFGSWSEAEAFLGIEIADNPMLEEMAQSEWTPPHEGDATPEDMRRCTVSMNYSLGLPDVIHVRADYFGDYFEGGPFGVNVDAFLRVKAQGREDTPVELGGVIQEEDVVEEYVTARGLRVTIVTGERTVAVARDGSTFQQHGYAACFAMNGAIFQVWTNFNEGKADDSLRLLKQVLDAYE